MTLRLLVDQPRQAASPQHNISHFTPRKYLALQPDTNILTDRMAHNGAGTQGLATQNSKELDDQIANQIAVQTADRQRSPGVKEHGGADEGQQDGSERHKASVEHTDGDEEATQESWSHTWGVWKGWRRGKRTPDLDALWQPWDDDVPYRQQPREKSRVADLNLPDEPSPAMIRMKKEIAHLEDEKHFILCDLHTEQDVNKVMKAFTRDVVAQGRVMFKACHRVNLETNLALAKVEQTKKDAEAAYNATETMEANAKDLVAQMTEAKRKWDDRMREGMERLTDEEVHMLIQEKYAQEMQVQRLQQISELATMRKELELERRRRKDVEMRKAESWIQLTLGNLNKSEYERGREEGKILGADLAFRNGYKQGGLHTHCKKKRWQHVSNEVEKATQDAEAEKVRACKEAYVDGWNVATADADRMWSVHLEEANSAAEKAIEYAKEEAREELRDEIREELLREFTPRTEAEKIDEFEATRAIGLYEGMLAGIANITCNDQNLHTGTTTDKEVIDSAKILMFHLEDSDIYIKSVARACARETSEAIDQGRDNLWSHALDPYDPYYYGNAMFQASDFGKKFRHYFIAEVQRLIDEQNKAREALESAASTESSKVVKKNRRRRRKNKNAASPSNVA